MARIHWGLWGVTSHIYSPLHRPHQSYLTNPSQHFPDLISSNHTHLDPASPHHIPIHSQNLSQNSCPQPQGCSGLPRSCGHHVMITQSHTTCATSSVSHFAGG